MINKNFLVIIILIIVNFIYSLQYNGRKKFNKNIKIYPVEPNMIDKMDKNEIIKFLFDDLHLTYEEIKMWEKRYGKLNETY